MKRIISTAGVAKASLAALLAAGMLLAAGPTRSAENKNDTDTYRYLQLFGGIFERVRADYVEERPTRSSSSPRSTAC